MIKLTLQHLDLMIDLRRSSKKDSTLSASKLKLALQLHGLGLLKQDEENNLFNSELGDQVLDAILYVFNKNAGTIE